MKRALAKWIAVCGGIGFLPYAPGTVASAVSLLLGYACYAAGGWTLLLAAAGISFAAGLWASGEYEKITGAKDPSAITIDEVSGQLTVLLFVPPTLMGYLLAFFLFRLLDITKPWPISLIERRLAGGWGVMGDDLAAALLAGLALLAIRIFTA